MRAGFMDTEEQYNPGTELTEADPNYMQTNAEDVLEQNDRLKIFRELHKEEIFPSEKDNPVVGSFWSVNAKKLKITFLSPFDEEKLMNRFEIMKLNYNMSRPRHKSSWQERMTIANLKNYFLFSMKGAIGMEAGRINERTVEQSIFHGHSFSQQGRAAPSGGGAFSWFRGKV